MNSLWIWLVGLTDFNPQWNY